MAISTYSELQTAVSNWLAGQVATTRIPEFIAMAEAEMSRLLYDNSAEKRAQTATAADVARVSLPSDCRKVRALRIVGARTTPLSYMAPSVFDRIGTSGTGLPDSYTVEANALRLSPVPDGEYTLEILYQQGVEALSDSSTTNDILTRHPDAYLHGSLMHGFDFLMDEARAAKSRQRFSELMSEIALEAERTRFGASPLQRRSPYREVR